MLLFGREKYRIMKYATKDTAVSVHIKESQTLHQVLLEQTKLKPYLLCQGGEQGGGCQCLPRAVALAYFWQGSFVLLLVFGIC